MHLYVLTRGIKNNVDQFITELQGKYFPFKYRNEKGEVKDMLWQFAVRPVQLWEFAFPEEHKDLILNSLFDGTKGEGQHPWYKKWIWPIRKALHCEPVSDYDKSKKIYIRKDDVEIVSIGIKGDYWITKEGKKVWKKEDGATEGL